ncbi:lipopolysaccharide heptosyltransferase II [Tundrisphaera lichenicola]|uniref:lipopolysaccharide heptosyltransferase II n=1 Tax=Tundrisphaera lichenicola TaxID=2029860 RepID=UPI003EBCC603
MTILVFCPNLVGDTAMATPAFRSLRLGFPGSKMIAVIKPKLAATLDGGPWFEEMVPFDPKSKRPEERSKAVVRRLRGERADLAVLFPNSFRSALMAWRSGARRRVGYDRGGRGFLLTDRLPAPLDEQGRFRVSPIVDYYREIPRLLGCPDDGPRLDLYTTPEDEAAADRAWSRLGLGPAKPVVTLNTGGAFGPAKSWPEGHFATLARRLVDEGGVSVLVVCGPGERDAARSIVAQAGRAEVVSLADEPMGLGLTKASIRRSSLLVTTDSGPRHFAIGFDVPVLTLFGPTHIEWTLTRHPRSLHLHHPVPCGPCQRPTCPEKHHRCLRDMSPDSVYAAALGMLRGSGTGVERIEAV